MRKINREDMELAERIRESLLKKNVGDFQELYTKKIKKGSEKIEKRIKCRQ